MNDDWVVVHNCVWIQEAQVVKSILEAANIDVLIPDENLLGAVPHYGIALGGARVLVRSRDLEEARQILEAMKTEDAGVEDSDEDEDE